MTNLGDCTNHAPALAYDHDSSRFVLLYLNHSTDGVQNRIMLRTSTDSGATWTLPQDLGAASFELPSISCGYGFACMLSYLRAWDNPPTLATTSLTIDPATGFASVGALTTNYVSYHHPPTAGHSWRSGLWLLGVLWSNSEVDRARGLGAAFTATSTTTPFPSYPWGPAITSLLFTSANLAVGDYYPDEYLVYTQ